MMRASASDSGLKPVILEFKLKDNGYEILLDKHLFGAVQKISGLPTWEEMKETVKFLLPEEEFILLWRGNRNGGQITAIPIIR